MADATSTSTYSNEQISKFKSLLKRVRDAGISVPTVSTDNSAALLTTTLNHFDPTELLTQKDGLNTRGFVRTGGAIYGQRPAFTQLKPVSTLVAAVRHVAILQAGESVGYDRAYIAQQAVRIATIAIGFADGYPRELGNKKGKVAIRNGLYPVGECLVESVGLLVFYLAKSNHLSLSSRTHSRKCVHGHDDGGTGCGVGRM